MEGIHSSAMSTGSFFTPLVISMAGIVSTAIVIVFYHLVLIKYCYRRQVIISNIPGRSEPISGTGGAQLGIGVDKNILETIPILAYSKIKGEAQFRLDQSECVVCLGEFHDGDMVRLLPNCRHAFHITCIDEWFLAHSSCPVCRSPIVAPAVTVVLPLPLETDDDEDNGGVVVDDDGVGLAESRHLLRHCVSMALPHVEEKWPRDLVMGLKRSLSMDQSHVLLNIQRKRESDSSSSSSEKDSIMRSTGSYGVRSMRQLDRVSSILLRSFSRLQMGRSSTSNRILPY